MNPSRAAKASVNCRLYGTSASTAVSSTSGSCCTWSAVRRPAASRSPLCAFTWRSANRACKHRRTARACGSDGRPAAVRRACAARRCTCASTRFNAGVRLRSSGEGIAAATAAQSASGPAVPDPFDIRQQVLEIGGVVQSATGRRCLGGRCRGESAQEHLARGLDPDDAVVALCSDRPFVRGQLEGDAVREQQACAPHRSRHSVITQRACQVIHALATAARRSSPPARPPPRLSTAARRRGAAVSRRKWWRRPP